MIRILDHPKSANTYRMEKGKVAMNNNGGGLLKKWNKNKLRNKEENMSVRKLRVNTRVWCFVSSIFVLIFFQLLFSSSVAFASVFAPVLSAPSPAPEAASLDINSPLGMKTNISPQAEKLEEKIEKGLITKPVKLSDLNSIDNSTQVYTIDQAAQLGLSFGMADAKYNRRIYVKNFIQYKEIVEGNIKVWYGIGIKWIVNVKIFDTNAKLSGIPAIAASTDSRSVEAQSRFQVYGLANNKITMIAQSVPAELNLENYGAMYAAFEKITELIGDKDTLVTPIVVGRVIEEKNEEHDYANSIIISWALSHIASGDTLLMTQKDLSPDLEFCDKELIKSVYVYFTKSDDLNFKPDNIAKERAKILLRGVKVRKGGLF